MTLLSQTARFDTGLLFTSLRPRLSCWKKTLVEAVLLESPCCFQDSRWRIVGSNGR
jgi:hypothetical protein